MVHSNLLKNKDSRASEDKPSTQPKQKGIIKPSNVSSNLSRKDSDTKKYDSEYGL